MKLVSFNYRDQERIGVVNEELRIVDLGLALPQLKDHPRNMIDFIRLGEEGLALAAQALAAGRRSAFIK